MDVDITWHMHEVSDGERRRVQIVSGLMAPWDILLLDEVGLTFFCCLTVCRWEGAISYDADGASPLFDRLPSILMFSFDLVSLTSSSRSASLEVLPSSTLLTFCKCLATPSPQDLHPDQTHHSTFSELSDGLDAFPTHLCHIQGGTTISPSPMPWPLPYKTAAIDEVLDGIPVPVRAAMANPDRAGSRLLEVALAWLGQDKVVRDKKEIDKYGSRKRGPKAETKDSETFYRK